MLILRHRMSRANDSFFLQSDLVESRLIKNTRRSTLFRLHRTRISLLRPQTGTVFKTQTVLGVPKDLPTGVNKKDYAILTMAAKDSMPAWQKKTFLQSKIWAWGMGVPEGKNKGAG